MLPEHGIAPGPYPQPQSPFPPQRKGGRGWLQALFTGIVLFIITTIIMIFTSNPNLFPTVILIGNFLIPIVFVVFLYDHQHITSLNTEMIAKTFVIGGVLGVLGASVLETFLVPTPSHPNQGLSFFGALIVGLIEEGCKIAAVMFMARRIRHNAEIDGLLMGAAVGMGFAALESTGYAFTVLLLSKGSLSASIFETVLRGILSPFGHGIWSAILGAALFRASQPNRFRITGSVILAYLFVSLLHACWDGLSGTLYLAVIPGINIPLIFLAVAIIGIITLVLVYRQSLHQWWRSPGTYIDNR